jgi:hypothetical protein
MFCVKCGKEVKKGTKFCTSCGAEIKEEKTEKDDKLTYSQNKSIETTSNPTPVAAPATTESTGDGKGTASLVLGIVSFVVPCVGFITSIVGLILGICAKKSGKKTAGIILNSIALGLIIIGWIFLYTLGYVAEWTNTYTNYSNTTPIVTPSTNNHTTTVSGSKFSFDNFEISIGNNYSFVVVDNDYSQYNGQSVIKLPVTLKNTSSEKDHLNMFYHSYTGPTGKSLPKLGAFWSDDSLEYGDDLLPGESYTKYIYLLYDGDGKYKIDFNNYKEKKTVEFSIKK